MALIGNYSLIAKSPGRFRAGVVNCDRSDYNTAGPSRNMFQRFAKFNSVPSGGTGWVIAQTPGGLASFTDMQGLITSSALLAAARNIGATISASVSITNAQLDQIANLGSSIAASGSFTNAQLAAVAAAAASLSASIGITSAQLGAIVGLSASLSASISLTNSNNFATASLSASISSQTALSPETLAASLWNSLASSYNVAGTMGEKLNDAGSASNPWTEVIEGSRTAQEVMRILLAVAAGRTTITDLGGGSAEVAFRDQANTKNRVFSNLTGSQRTSVTLDVS